MATKQAGAALQSITMGIALPDWLLDAKSRRAPMVLAGLVFGGILLPLGIAACYLLSANKYIGPNGIMEETYDFFLRCARAMVLSPPAFELHSQSAHSLSRWRPYPIFSKQYVIAYCLSSAAMASTQNYSSTCGLHRVRRSPVGVRESQGLTRIPDTLTVAMEFITMPTLPEQLPAVEELRKQTLRYGLLRLQPSRFRSLQSMAPGLPCRLGTVTQHIQRCLYQTAACASAHHTTLS